MAELALTEHCGSCHAFDEMHEIDPPRQHWKLYHYDAAVCCAVTAALGQLPEEPWLRRPERRAVLPYPVGGVHQMAGFGPDHPAAGRRLPPPHAAL